MSSDSTPDFLLGLMIDKLNKRASTAADQEDEIYKEHEQREERKDFLKSATPAFFFSLSSELLKKVEQFNLRIVDPADRVQVHVGRSSMQDLLITSNVEPTEWSHNDISIEVATHHLTDEIVVVYRRPIGFKSDSVDMCLYRRDKDSLGIASNTKSFSVPDYASYLFREFLEHRELLKNPDDDE